MAVIRVEPVIALQTRRRKLRAQQRMLLNESRETGQVLASEDNFEANAHFDADNENVPQANPVFEFIFDVLCLAVCLALLPLTELFSMNRLRGLRQR